MKVNSNIVNELKLCAAKTHHANQYRDRRQRDIYIVTALINAYAKCGCMVSARRLFDSVLEPSLICWNTLLHGYATNGEARAALGLFSTMKYMGCTPDCFTYVAALKACASLAAKGAKAEALERCRLIHSEAVNQLDLYVQSMLIDVYAKCGRPAEARKVFDTVQEPDIVSYNALLLAYTENGHCAEALELFTKMKSISGCVPTTSTYVTALKACTSLAGIGEREAALQRGAAIHLEIGCQTELYVSNTLIDMYAKCGSMPLARRVFDDLQDPDVVSWNALLLGYAVDGKGEDALELFSRMKNTPGCAPNAITYVAALKACTSLAMKGDKQAALRQGSKIHAEAAKHLDCYVQSTLIEMYSSCGGMFQAQQVFDGIHNPDVVSWNALLLGYAVNEEGQTALDKFSAMKASSGCVPDSFTYVAALKACASLAVNGYKNYALRKGKELHSEISCHCMETNAQCTLIDMYAKCGSMLDARSVFDAAPWKLAPCNALLMGYAENGEGRVTLELFSRMKNTPGCAPNVITYVSALKACTSLAANGEREEALKRGREIHLEAACHLDLRAHNTLIDMYANCGSMVDARRVFDGLHHPDVISWNCLLLGYAEAGEGGVALELFARMKNTAGCSPDAVTYIAALKSCGQVGDLALGRKLHAEVNEFINPRLLTCLVDMYAKCGSMREACEVYDAQPRAREVSTWNAVLAGYARGGSECSSLVFGLFAGLGDAGLQPDAVTFVCVLTCCSHAGLVEQARACFEGMKPRYGVSADVRHYTCMVDVLGRSNQLREAMELLRTMPCLSRGLSNRVPWMTLLGACHKWKNVEVGRWAFQSLMDMDKEYAPPYVLMSQIYGRSTLENMP